MPRYRDGVVPPNEAARVTTDISAHPTGSFEQVARNPEVEGLLRAADRMNSTMESLGAAQRAKADEERKAGAAAARSGAEKDATKGKTWLQGFTEGTAEAAAIVDAEDLAKRYDTEVDKTQPGVDKFISSVYDSKMKGQTDPVYKAAYDKVFGDQAQKLRAGHADQLAKGVMTTNRATFDIRARFAAQQSLSKGPLGPEFMGVFNQIADDQKIGFADRNEALFSVLDGLSRDGHIEVWELAKLPRPDGTPGIYNVKDLRSRIDSAIVRDQNAAETQRDRDYRRLEKDRKDRQSAAALEVLDLHANGDPIAARTRMDELSRDRRLFPHGDELLAFRKLIKDSENDFERPGEEAKFNDYYIDVFRSDNLEKLMNTVAGDTNLSARNRRQLVTDIRAEMGRRRAEASAARTAAAAERTNVNAWARDPMFDATRDALVRRLKPEKSPFDMKFDATDAYRARAAQNANTEFMRWQSNNPQATQSERDDQAEIIATRYEKHLDRVRATRSQELSSSDANAPFNSLEELNRAGRAGTIDPESYQHYRRYFIEKDAGKGK